MNYFRVLPLTLSLVFILSPLRLTLYPNPTFAQTTIDVSSQIENLGNPTKTKWPDTNTACRYARNIWDMETFNGKVYLGSGNSSNSSPCPNAGPVPLISYNPTTNLFSTETTVAEHQIDLFRQIDFGTGNGPQLVLPGHDPAGADNITWDRLESGTWVLHQASPSVGSDVKHVYDLLLDGSDLVAGSGGLGASVFTSTDNNKIFNSWVPTDTPEGYRAYTLFKIGGKVYASHAWNYDTDTSREFYGGGLWEKSTATSFTRLTTKTMPVMFPATTPVTSSIIRRPTNYQNSLLYIGAQNINDHQWNPFGLYKVGQVSPTGGIGNPSRINHPTQSLNAKPWDIELIDQKAYILWSYTQNNNQLISVTSSTDLTNWSEEFHFSSASFARSFENLNGDWYFGLGTDTVTLSTATGDILRYKPQAIPSPSTTTKLGDIDGDGNVDIFDYNQLLTDFGKLGSGIRADIDNSGKVDIFDYNLLLTNFGK